MKTRTVLLILLAGLLWRGSPQTVPIRALDQLVASARAGVYGNHPLHLFLAHGIGATSQDAYVSWGVLLLGLAYLVVWWLARHRWGAMGGNQLFALFLASPIAYLLLQSIGLEDALAVLGVAPLLLCRNPWLLGAAGIVGAFAHPSCLLAGGALLWLRYLAGEELDYRAGVGLLIGLVAVLLCFPGTLNSRWDYIFTQGLGRLLYHHLVYLPLALWSFGLALWLPGVVAGRLLWRARPWYAGALGVYLLFSWAVTALMLDTTRVFVLLTWAPLLHGLLVAGETADETYHDLLRLTARWGWLAPALGIWSGEIRSNGWTAWLSWVGWP